MGMSADAYARQLKQLLPPGRLWRLEPAAVLSKILLGISDELARIDARGEDLLDEWDPRTASETLEDWERVLGITPAAGSSEDERRIVAAARYIARGGATPAYFVALAASLGFTATVTEIPPHRWRMDVDLASSTSPHGLHTTEFRAGAGRSGDPLRSWTVPELEEVINTAKPAHTRALFAYTE